MKKKMDMVTKLMLDTSKKLLEAKTSLEMVDIDLPYEDEQLNNMLERMKDIEQEFDTWMMNQEEECAR